MMQSPIRYVVFNGPPGSGKTTMARELAREIRQDYEVVSDSFAAPIKHFFAVALADKYDNMDKQVQRAELAGASLRAALIHLAEDHIKPLYGDDTFGKWLVYRSLKTPTRRPDFVIVDDGGFPSEIEALPNRYVIRVYRKDKNFTGDSRRYVENFNCSIHNDGDMAEMWKSIKALAHNIKVWASK